MERTSLRPIVSNSNRRSFHARAPSVRVFAVAFALTVIPALALAGETEWRRYAIPSTGTSVEMPVTIFTRDAGPPEGGTGRRFFTDDNRADLTVQSVPNPDNDSTRHIPGEEKPAGRHHLQAGDAGFLRRVQHSQRPHLVQPLQPGGRRHELRADQLSRRRKAPVGRRGHTDKPHAEGLALGLAGPNFRKREKAAIQFLREEPCGVHCVAEGRLSNRRVVL